ncbi:MAG: hypothetical protein ACMG6S_28870 [Byssovorax sp.]
MRLQPPSRWLHSAFCLVGLIFAGCVVSPQPEPPAIIASLLSIEGRPGSVTLKGAAGAVQPGGSELSTIDLDTSDPATAITVADDGSFSLVIAGTPADDFRLQAFSGGLRSDPLDVTSHSGLWGGGTTTLVVTPLESCFLLAPARELGPITASSSATVQMTNHCTDDVTVSGLDLRLGSPAFTIPPGTIPLVIPAQGAGAFTVTFNPQPGAPAEDILFVEMSAPVQGRRPLTVRGQTP